MPPAAASEAEPHHGGERVHFGGRVQVHAPEAVLVLDGAHEIRAEQGVVDGEVADAGLQARGARQRGGERLAHTRRRPGGKQGDIQNAVEHGGHTFRARLS